MVKVTLEFSVALSTQKNSQSVSQPLSLTCQSDERLRVQQSGLIGTGKVAVALVDIKREKEEVSQSNCQLD